METVENHKPVSHRLPPSLGNPAEAAGFPLSHRFDDDFFSYEKNPQTPFGKPKGHSQAKSPKPDRSRVNKTGQIDKRVCALCHPVFRHDPKPQNLNSRRL